MIRTCERKYIENWLEDNYPNAITKLSIATDIPSSTLQQIRYGRVPKDKSRIKKLCEVLSVPEENLFPLTPNLIGAS